MSSVERHGWRGAALNGFYISRIPAFWRSMPEPMQAAYGLYVGLIFSVSTTVLGSAILVAANVAYLIPIFIVLGGIEVTLTWNFFFRIDSGFYDD